MAARLPLGEVDVSHEWMICAQSPMSFGGAARIVHLRIARFCLDSSDSLVSDEQLVDAISLSQILQDRAEGLTTREVRRRLRSRGVRAAEHEVARTLRTMRENGVVSLRRGRWVSEASQRSRECEPGRGGGVHSPPDTASVRPPTQGRWKPSESWLITSSHPETPRLTEEPGVQPSAIRLCSISALCGDHAGFIAFGDHWD